MGRKPAALLLALGTSVILSAQAPEQPGCGGRSNNPRSACPSDVDRMTAALPDKAPARPQKPRKVLVLGRAAGYVHSSIPLAAKTIEAMGAKTGAWTATTTYDAADINTANLAQYDAIFLASTTGCFLDDANDAAATAARRAAFMAFVRGGKGIAGIHAASDSYHGAQCAQPMASAGEPLWPELNRMIGGYFKFHWNNPQLITVKIDDPNSPLTKSFGKESFEHIDEFYQFPPYSPYSREKQHILLSIDVPKSDRATAGRFCPECTRPDQDYGLAWIRTYGKGRTYFTPLGHTVDMYTKPMWTQHLLAAIQYILGDLDADATPSGHKK